MTNAMKLVGAVLGLLLWGAARAGTVTYVYTDPQGTPLAEADASGNITARFEYTPYGVSVPSIGAAPNGVGYTGHVNDPETGFVYMQARYYDADVGRFLSVDPVGFAYGQLSKINRYIYSLGNPSNMIDPDGRDSLWVQNGSRTTIVIPVHFVGEGSNNRGNIAKIISMAKALNILDRRYSISIVSTDKAINGVLNTMDLSSGYKKEYLEAGEGVNQRGGNMGHINIENGDWLRAALHDILHFASFRDGYVAAGKGDARVIVGYLTGYSVDSIMASRSRTGNTISQDEIVSADDYGRRTGKNRICRYEKVDDNMPPSLVCGL